MADGNITVTVISRPPTPPGWSDTDWLRHLESCPPIGYAVRDTLYGTSKAGVLRLCSSTEAGAFAIYAAPQPQATEPSQDTPPQGEPVQEPDRGWLEAAVAWEVCGSIHATFAKGKDALFKTRHADFVKHAEDARAKAKLYAAPQQRKPLTEEQILEIRKELVLSPNKYHSHYGWSIAFARLIEAAHGIKETP